MEIQNGVHDQLNYLNTLTILFMRKLLFFSLFVFKCSLLQSQFDDKNAVALPSVNNNFLNIKDYGVNPYTGTALRRQDCPMVRQNKYS